MAKNRDVPVGENRARRLLLQPPPAEYKLLAGNVDLVWAI